jgi:hypothetical protein
MRILSSIKSLVYASFTDKVEVALLDDTELRSFSFFADTKNCAIFEQNADIACGMLERVIKSFGFATVLPFITHRMFSNLRTPELVSRVLQAGFDASALMESFSMHLKSPV